MITLLYFHILIIHNDIVINKLTLLNDTIDEVKIFILIMLLKNAARLMIIYFPIYKIIDFREPVKVY